LVSHDSHCAGRRGVVFARATLKYRRCMTTDAPVRRGMRVGGALLRYRIMAFVTASCSSRWCSSPFRWTGGVAAHGPVAVIGTAHGFLFMVYLVTALDLGVRRGGRSCG